MVFHFLGNLEKIKTKLNSGQNSFLADSFLVKFTQLIKTQTYKTEGVALDFIYLFSFSFYIQPLYLVGMEPGDRKMDHQWSW